MENYQTLVKIIAEHFNVDSDTIKPETDLIKDLQADSLDLVEIISDVERDFGIEISDDESETVFGGTTVQKILDLLNKKLQ